MGAEADSKPRRFLKGPVGVVQLQALATAALAAEQDACPWGGTQSQDGISSRWNYTARC